MVLDTFLNAPSLNSTTKSSKSPCPSENTSNPTLLPKSGKRAIFSDDNPSSTLDTISQVEPAGIVISLVPKLLELKVIADPPATGTILIYLLPRIEALPLTVTVIGAFDAGIGSDPAVPPSLGEIAPAPAPPPPPPSPVSLS